MKKWNKVNDINQPTRQSNRAVKGTFSDTKFSRLQKFVFFLAFLGQTQTSGPPLPPLTPWVKKWAHLILQTSLTLRQGRQQCFFFPEKKKVLPEKIFKILPEKICKCPRKNLENCPRRKNCTREKFSKFAPEKKKSVGEKKITNFPLKIAKNPRKFFDLCPRNPNFNPRKKIILRLRKRPSARENLCKSGREK